MLACLLLYKLGFYKLVFNALAYGVKMKIRAIYLKSGSTLSEKDWFTEIYVNCGSSTKRVAHHLECSEPLVRKELVKHGIVVATLYEYEGKYYTAAKIHKLFASHLSYRTTLMRLIRGWTVERVINTKIRRVRRK